MRIHAIIATQSLPILCLICSLPVSAPALADPADEPPIYESEEMVQLATGYQQRVTQAPAVISVLKADALEALGVRTIGEALQHVPGIHVSRSRIGDDIYSFRSIHSELNPQVLLMIDGVVLGDAAQGGRPLGWSMPIDNVSRIEVVRGPGSALYGADAFAGTINIITKVAQELPTAEAGVRVGAFSELGAYTQGHLSNDTGSFTWYVAASESDGAQRRVEQDRSTALDAQLGTRSSQAPGAFDDARREITARLGLTVGDSLTSHVHLQTYDVGNGAGTVSSLDPQGNRTVQLYAGDVTYKSDLSETLGLTLAASALHSINDLNLSLFPPGAFGVFSDGVRNDVEFTTNDIRSKASFLYTGLDHHTFFVGPGVNYQAARNFTDKRNFLVTPFGLAPTGIFTTAQQLGQSPAGDDDDRLDIFVFAQDEWHLARDWTLTYGARLDHFSDEGTRVNPRASLVWNISPTLTAKALYGRAFRPATFLETTPSQASGAAARGDPSLNSETIDTMELALEKKWAAASLSANVYRYFTDDLIILSPLPDGSVMFANSEGTDGLGLELEARYKPFSRFELRASYALQRAWDKQTDKRLGITPEHLVYASMTWRINDGWRTSLSNKYIASRHRAPGDVRKALDNYVWSDLTVGFTPHRRPDVECTIGVRNVFNADAREPSTDPSIVNDLPLAERHVRAQLRVRF